MGPTSKTNLDVSDGMQGRRGDASNSVANPATNRHGEDLGLKERLDRGELAALLGAGVTTLLEKAGDWWPDASEECTNTVLDVLGGALSPTERVAAIESWRLEVTPGQPPPPLWSQRLAEVEQELECGSLRLVTDDVDGESEPESEGATRSRGLPPGSPGMVADVVDVECEPVLERRTGLRLLARRLADRQPAEPSPEVTQALAALSVLERFPVA